MSPVTILEMFLSIFLNFPVLCRLSNLRKDYVALSNLRVNGHNSQQCHTKGCTLSDYVQCNNDVQIISDRAHHTLSETVDGSYFLCMIGY